MGASTLYRTVVNQVARKHGVTAEQIKSRSRTGPIALARHEVFYVLAGQFRWSLPFIGSMQGVEHTTVLSGIRRYSHLMNVPMPVHLRPRGLSPFGRRPRRTSKVQDSKRRRSRGMGTRMNVQAAA